jgi:glutamate N-acetyltransferase/amino-acid N-acetyltransferase
LVVVNSGTANVFSGQAGRDAVAQTARGAADAFGGEAASVQIASTGVIGVALKAEKLVKQFGAMAERLSPDGWEAAARAIMTTDTFAKGASQPARIGDTVVTINGIAKGSGMIAPDMATMLVYIFTDARIDPALLRDTLRALTEKTFNAITVDGDTSTSDTLLIAATGQAGPHIAPDTPEAAAFTAALSDVMRELAHLVVRDGEGATKFLEVQVTGAASAPDARAAALAIANSPLVKTAIAGEDPNWGRVVMAVGKSGAQADRDKLSIWFGPHIVAQNGWVSPEYREDIGADYMKKTDLTLRVDLGLGDAAFTAWTCDLTHDYIRINADYRS